MKYLKNIIAVLVLVGIFHMSYSAEVSVDDITVLDANTLSVTLSENPTLEIGEIEAEIRILSDVKLRGAFPDETDITKVELLLQDPILTNTTYSLLTVLGGEGSIDFTTPSDVEGFMVSNISSVENQDIDTIEIIDDRTIIVTYRNELLDSILEYKLLAENEVTKIEKPDFYLPEIIVTIEPPFTRENDYILMIIEMQDASGDFLEFDTGIYDFTSPENLDILSAGEILKQEEVESNESLEVLEVIEVIEVNNENTDEENTPKLEITDSEEIVVDLEAAGPDLEKIGTLEAAGMVKQTPNTGAQTWILILGTLVINSFYYLSRRKKVIRPA